MSSRLAALITVPSGSSAAHRGAAVSVRHAPIQKQAAKLPYVAPGFTTEVAVEAIEALRSVMPKGLDKFFFSTSGTEANDGALVMTR